MLYVTYDVIQPMGLFRIAMSVAPSVVFKHFNIYLALTRFT